MPIELKIRNVPFNLWPDALVRARHFQLSYPDRRGLRDGCGYLSTDGFKYYVYRTKTLLVVIGNE